MRILALSAAGILIYVYFPKKGYPSQLSCIEEPSTQRHKARVAGASGPEGVAKAARA